MADLITVFLIFCAVYYFLMSSVEFILGIWSQALLSLALCASLFLLAVLNPFLH